MIGPGKGFELSCKRSFSMFARVAVAFLLLGLSAAQDNIPRMEEVIQSYVSSKTFMGSVLVARGDKIILSTGYGFANLEWQVPDTPDTKYRLGSITKQFTAACILLLEERGGGVGARQPRAQTRSSGPRYLVLL